MPLAACAAGRLRSAARRGIHIYVDVCLHLRATLRSAIMRCDISRSAAMLKISPPRRALHIQIITPANDNTETKQRAGIGQPQQTLSNDTHTIHRPYACQHRTPHRTAVEHLRTNGVPCAPLAQYLAHLWLSIGNSAPCCNMKAISLRP